MDPKLNIFLATDYSEAVMNAERYAFEFAKKTGSNLTVLHIYETPFSFPLEQDEYIKASERLRKFELHKLKVHCEKLFRILKIKQNEIRWECLALQGNIGTEIRKEAEHNHPDLVITGTHNSDESSFFGSSHTWEIIKKANTPVLSIPPSALFTDIKKIVFAAEYRQGEISAIQSLNDIANKFEAELTILHITNHTITKDFEAMLLENFKRDIRNNTSCQKLDIRIVYAEDVVKGLNDFCLKSKADWLVVSHSKKFFLEKIFLPSTSITKEMSFHSNIPLLSVPDFYVDSKKVEDAENLTETLIFKQKGYTPG